MAAGAARTMSGAPGWTNGKVSGLKSRALARALRVRLPPRVSARPGGCNGAFSPGPGSAATLRVATSGGPVVLLRTGPHPSMEASALNHVGTEALRGPTPLLRIQSDERLVAMTRRGNQAAYEALVARY